MAEMKAKHAFGQSTGIEAAKQAKKIDAFDILFLDGETEPKVGWLDSKGNTVIVDHRVDLAKAEAKLEAEIATKANVDDVTQLETKLATKVSSEEVDSKIEAALNEIERVPETYERVKYEITDAPAGTLIDMRDAEIRIMVPQNSQFVKQNVGSGGDPNTHYVTFKTYVYDDNVVGYKEILNGQVDAEILTNLKTDEYGRRYQATWLGVAKYDKTTDTWSYDGVDSSIGKYVGWDYTLQLFNADNVMIASDSVRINLSNEDCHYEIRPYYATQVTEETETMVEEVVEEKMETKVEEAVTTSNAYTDTKIAELEEALSNTMVEF